MPSSVEKPIVTAWSVAADRVTGNANIVVPVFPSASITSPIEIVTGGGGVTSSTIVPVAEAVPIVALPGTDRLTTNVLSGVSMLLPTNGDVDCLRRGAGRERQRAGLHRVVGRRQCRSIRSREVHGHRLAADCRQRHHEGHGGGGAGVALGQRGVRDGQGRHRVVVLDSHRVPFAFSMVPPTAEVSVTLNPSSSSSNASPLTLTRIESLVAPWGS